MSQNPAPEDRPRVLVTGATGYIGGRLVPRLLAAGYPVRCLARSPRKLSDRPWTGDPRVLWIHLVTPLSREIAIPLAEGLRNRVVCRDDAAVQLTSEGGSRLTQTARFLPKGLLGLACWYAVLPVHAPCQVGRATVRGRDSRSSRAARQRITNKTIERTNIKAPANISR